jgi:hypothetical protein
MMESEMSFLPRAFRLDDASHLFVAVPLAILGSGLMMALLDLAVRTLPSA